MLIVHQEILISAGTFASSSELKQISNDIRDGIKSVVWPPGSNEFSIFPESGKKSGQGNGVKPIKIGMMRYLELHGWSIETPIDIATLKKPGKLDAARTINQGIYAFEWETGNISSSHRALNKMALGLLHGKLIGGTLVVPSRKLYKYLTDRIGNYAELEPYLDLWKSIPIKNGYLDIVVMEHDRESTEVERIPKGTDGRSLI